MAEIDLTAAIEAGQARIDREYEDRVGFAARRTDRGQEFLAVAEAAIRAAAPLIERAARQRAADEISAHADEYAPRDGTKAQRNLRRHLLIAARVASPKPTLEETAALLVALHAQVTAGDPPESMARTGAKRSGTHPPAVTPPGEAIA